MYTTDFCSSSQQMRELGKGPGRTCCRLLRKWFEGESFKPRNTVERKGGVLEQSVFCF